MMKIDGLAGERAGSMPSSPAALSSSRSAVVPTRRCARRRARAAFSASAVSALDRAPFGMHPVVFGVVGLDRQEGAGADMQRDAYAAPRRAPSAAPSRSGVKCRPAVGAATEPSSRANRVW